MFILFCLFFGSLGTICLVWVASYLVPSGSHCRCIVGGGGERATLKSGFEVWRWLPSTFFLTSGWYGNGSCSPLGWGISSGRTGKQDSDSLPPVISVERGHNLSWSWWRRHNDAEHGAFLWPLLAPSLTPRRHLGLCSTLESSTLESSQEHRGMAKAWRPEGDP